MYRAPVVVFAVLLLTVACAAEPEGTPAAMTPGIDNTPAGTPADGTPDSTTPGSATPANGTPADGENSVRIVDFSFNPSSLSVPGGTTVTWTNAGNLPHTVTSDDRVLDSGTLAPGDTFEHTFDDVGTYDYICSIHPTMRASVTVNP